MRASRVYIFTTDYLGELQVRVLVVQHQISILMVFVPVVVLEVIELVMIRVPSFDYHILIPFSGGLEEFLDPWCDLLHQKNLEEPLFVEWRRKFS